MKQKYECKTVLTCVDCGSKIVANNANQKYCAICIDKRIQAGKRASYLKAKAKKAAKDGSKATTTNT